MRMSYKMMRYIYVVSVCSQKYLPIICTKMRDLHFKLSVIVTKFTKQLVFD
jgi:hypothetical protein